jgi:SET domain-containing protein
MGSAPGASAGGGSENRPFFPGTKIAARYTADRGRGVFALATIDEGEVIESCPLLVFGAVEVTHLFETSLSNYLFKWGPFGEGAACALGFGSLYNHSHSPNAVYVRKPDRLDFVALRTIDEGEEVTVSYNGGVGDRTPVWFEPDWGHRK